MNINSSYSNALYKEVFEMPSRKGVTTIQLEKKTRDRLMDLGKKGESYDQIINKLVDFWKKRKKRQA
jgi:hypothetical protein